MSKNIGNFQDYIKDFNKEIGKAEKQFRYLAEDKSNLTKAELKNDIQITLATLQIAAYGNEIYPLTLNRDDVKEIGLIMFEGKESNNYKALRISKPHKKLKTFFEKHKALFDEYGIFNNVV